MFPKIGGKPQNGWFIVENLIKMDDLGVPLFSETPICFQSLSRHGISIKARLLSLIFPSRGYPFFIQPHRNLLQDRVSVCHVHVVGKTPSNLLKVLMFVCHNHSACVMESTSFTTSVLSSVKDSTNSFWDASDNLSRIWRFHRASALKASLFDVRSLTDSRNS